MEFVNWNILATYAGALSMVLVITQMTKSLWIIKKIPTQLWSYLMSLLVLYPAYYFTGQLTAANAVLILFNGMLVALAANGGYTVLHRLFPEQFKMK